jgi:hypothetical protein
MKKHFFYILLVGANGLFLVSSVFAQSPLSTNLPFPPGFASHEAYIQSLTNKAEVARAAQAGFLSQEEVMSLAVSAENRRSIGIFGKVVDQNEKPMAGVDVTGSVARIQGWYGEKKWEGKPTKTDANGLFEFIGLTGADWSVSVKRDGYIIDYSKGCSGPRGGAQSSQSTPTNRIVLKMWKQRGAEPMKHVKLHTYVACDGTPVRFDLLTGKKDTNGDLTVSITREPLSILRSQPFTWTLTLAVTNGGLVEISANTIYPYEAPVNGYQTLLNYHYAASAIHWTPEITPAFYFTSRNGQIYGRMNLDVIADFQPPPTLFNAEIYANPNSSRNLEFDPQKQITR